MAKAYNPGKGQRHQPASAKQQPQPRHPSLQRRLKISARKKSLIIIGSILIAGSWWTQTFIVENNKDEIDELNSNVTEFMRIRELGVDNDWRLTFAYFTSVQASDTNLLKDKQRVAASQELSSIYSLHLTTARMLIGDVSVEDAEDQYRTATKNLKVLDDKKDDSQIQQLLIREKNWISDNHDKVITLAYRRIKKLKSRSSLARSLFVIFVIAGTLLITFNNTYEYVMGPEAEA
ncbi:MAG: hypothetical protein BGO55_00680 [Sphingobacteriales bacterium 50-39]|nr:hypothetical protein [Sphingobacteriales bacterium]OJW53630.1 MAG: hypothetical protein BGO55_00680 [Sphingobacteriales bacterium 50-39]